MNRKDLQDKINTLNQLYQEKDLEMRKLGGSQEQRQALRDMMNKKKEQLISEMGDSLQKLNIGQGVNVSGGTVSKIQDLGSNIPDALQNAKLDKFKRLAGSMGKKVAGIIPLAGVGMAMMDSPAASASEMVMDPKVQRAALSEIAGPVGDVIDIGGDVAEAGLDKLGEMRDQDMIESGESRARTAYQKSPARLDRLKRILQGND